MNSTVKHQNILSYISKLQLPLKKRNNELYVAYFDFQVSLIQKELDSWFEMTKNELLDFLKSRSVDKEVDEALVNKKLHDAGITSEDTFYVHFHV